MSRTQATKLTFTIYGSLFFTMSATAQTTNASIIGDITDPQQAAVVGATVTVQTSPTGSYRVFPLMPGRYEVAATAAGFKRKIQPSVVLDIASTVKVDF